MYVRKIDYKEGELEIEGKNECDAKKSTRNEYQKKLIHIQHNNMKCSIVRVLREIAK